MTLSQGTDGLVFSKDLREWTLLIDVSGPNYTMSVLLSLDLC